MESDLCVSPFLCHFLLNIAACTMAYIDRRTFERKVPFATTSFIKGGGLIFKDGPIFERFQ